MSWPNVVPLPPSGNNPNAQEEPYEHNRERNITPVTKRMIEREPWRAKQTCDWCDRDLDRDEARVDLYSLFGYDAVSCCDCARAIGKAGEEARG